MNPLKIAMIVKGSAATLKRDDKNMGYFSYPVSPFTWEHFILDRCTPREKFKDFDLILVEDSSMGGICMSKGGPPVAFLCIDSTLSDDHYFNRLEKARNADLTLIDHDRLDRFKSVAKRVRALPYCVNDKVFKPGANREIDVNFHCASGETKGHPGGKERVELRRYLADICKLAGYSYFSGTAPLPIYADHMGTSKVVVNWPRTPINRPHRIFDAMASGACVVTGKLPDVEGDLREAGRHYIEFDKHDDLPAILAEMIRGGVWEFIASQGLELVLVRHTWAIRAQELRQILREELGL